MSKSNAAVLAAECNSTVEVPMPRALKITRAPTTVDFIQIDIKRDGKPDIRLSNGRLLLTVETEPGRFGDPGRHLHGSILEGGRWRVWRLYENQRGDRAVVATEGHSTLPGETTRYSATICLNGADAWEEMGKHEELKPFMAELGWPAIEEI